MSVLRSKIACVVGAAALVLVALSLGSCGGGGEGGNGDGSSKTAKPQPVSDQESYYYRWASKNATDAQIDALISAMPKPVEGWHATVTNVTENGDYTIIETAYRNQTYELWMFEPEARDKARQLYAQTDVVFSGELVQELSLTRAGARENPEFGVYTSRVVAGGLEITQTSEGIANQHERDRQAEERARAASDTESRDGYYESEVITFCKEMVTEKLQFPVSGEFSWFQGKTRKESDTKWVYTDVVASITESGEKASARFVCTVEIKGDSLEGTVQFLD